MLVDPALWTKWAEVLWWHFALYTLWTIYYIYFGQQSVDKRVNAGGETSTLDKVGWLLLCFGPTLLHTQLKVWFWTLNCGFVSSRPGYIRSLLA